MLDLGLNVMEEEVSEKSDVSDDTKKKQIRKFKQNSNEKDIESVSKRKFAPESNHKIKWVLNMYNEWRTYRMRQQNCPVEVDRCDLSSEECTFSEADLSFVLARFIHEIKKIYDTDYPPNTLRGVIIMIQMCLNQKGFIGNCWNIQTSSHCAM